MKRLQSQLQQRRAFLLSLMGAAGASAATFALAQRPKRDDDYSNNPPDPGEGEAGRKYAAQLVGAGKNYALPRSRRFRFTPAGCSSRFIRTRALWDWANRSSRVARRPSQRRLRNWRITSLARTLAQSSITGRLCIATPSIEAVPCSPVPLVVSIRHYGISRGRHWCPGVRTAGRTDEVSNSRVCPRPIG